MKNVTDNLKIKSWIMDLFSCEVVRLNADSQIFNANSKLRKSLDNSKKECTTLSFTDINITVSPEVWKTNWNEVIEKGSVRFKATHKNKGGKFYDAEVYA